MSKISRTVKIALLGILIVIVAAVVATFVHFNPIPTVQAASAVMEPMAPDAARDCTISNILAAPDRIHVRCTLDVPSLPGVYYYAISADALHATEANRYLVLLNTAYALNKPVNLYYDTLSSHNPTSCLVSDCRLLTGVIIY